MADRSYMVPALEKGLRILEMFSRSTRVLSQSEMAARLGVSPNSLYRILQTLATMGYLEKTGVSSYSLGSQIVSRGFSYLASREIVELAAPFVLSLRDNTSLSSHLAVRDGSQALYVFRALALQRVSVNVPVGTRFPCHVTAMGRALLSGMTPEQLRVLYRGERLDGNPEPAPRTLPELILLLERENARGWHMHYSDESTAIAVPIRDLVGEVVAAINLSGPDSIMQKEGVQEELAAILIEASREVMHQLGA
jgi:DNA-binding IclR family transcriptional regulator